MRYFPIFADLGAQKRIAVFGGGEDAARKVRLFARSQATLDVHAAELTRELGALLQSGRINHVALPYDAQQLDGAACVIVADAGQDEARISADAQARSIPVNVVDKPELSSFIVPAIVDRDPLVVAIGTEGAGPVLAQGIRAQIERLLPPALGGLLQRAAEIRPDVARVVPGGAARRRFWERFFFGSVRELFFKGDEAAFRREVTRVLSLPDHHVRGAIAVIEAPQDPELMTIKAHRLLQQADRIVFDQSVSDAVLGYARRDAVRTPSGFDGLTAHPERIAECADELLRLARDGHSVVRLTSGDACATESEINCITRLAAGTVALDVVPGVCVQRDQWAPLFGDGYGNATFEKRIA